MLCVDIKLEDLSWLKVGSGHFLESDLQEPAEGEKCLLWMLPAFDDLIGTIW